MTQEFQYLMHLLGDASRGEPAQPPQTAISWDKVFKLAQEQHIIPLIALVCTEKNNLGCPIDLLRDRTRGVFSSVITDCARRGSVVALLEEMNQAGIPSYMVKGMVAAANYAAPERRISSDTDICIDPSNEARACRWLEQQGFSVAPRWRSGHHAVAHHPKMGTLEVHVRLYDELAEDVWFRQVDAATLICEPQQSIMTADGTYNTLGDTDHLIFMALHMIKHFICSGMSLRMMMDVALYLAHKKDVLHVDRFWSVLETLHYVPLMNSILWAMVRFCGFHPEDFPGLGPCCEDHILQILTDVETGGWLGMNNRENRKRSGYAYNQELMLRQLSPVKYRLYMFKWRHGLSLRTFFPERSQLLPAYPWLAKYPLLLPAAWVHRLFFRGLAAWKKERTLDNDISGTTTESAEWEQRLTLFRTLNML